MSKKHTASKASFFASTAKYRDSKRAALDNEVIEALKEKLSAETGVAISSTQIVRAAIHLLADKHGFVIKNGEK